MGLNKDTAAFDHVWHLVIANKFPSYGIHQSTTIWSNKMYQSLEGHGETNAVAAGISEAFD